MDAIQHALHLARQPRAAGGAAGDAVPGVDFDHGFLKTAGHGRTDNIPVNVPNGAYVLPADILSGLGQGNTLAGVKTMDRVLQPIMRHVQGGERKRVPIIAAGGEFIIHPDVVAWVPVYFGDAKTPNLKKGHDMLDRFVKYTRAETHKTLGKLPGPAKAGE